MAVARSKGGRFSPSMGMQLPAEGYTGRPGVDCPEVCDEARGWWAGWATSQFAHYFTVEWQNLADTARLVDKWHRSDFDVKYASEIRQREDNLFGLRTKIRLYVTEEAAGDPDAAPTQRKPRQDPRLKAV